MSLNPKYTHLFFDLDNTLWDFDRNARLAMQDTVEELKLLNKIEDFDQFYAFYEGVNHQLWEAYRKQEIRKNELITKRFADTLSEFKMNGIDPVTMNNLYLGHMARQTSLVEGTMELLTTLKQRNLRLQIITNGFREVQLNKLKNSRLDHFFDHVFISEDLSFPKPDIRVFQHAIRSSNAKKEKSIMIGDNWETDIIGARNFGIDQVFFSKDRKNREHPIFSNTSNQKNDTFVTNTHLTKTFCIQNLTNISLII